jgi:hypothetical protein
MKYEIIKDYAEQVRLIQPIMRSLGSDIPREGCGVVIAQIDDKGEVMAFQILQNALFAEGLWARDASANLRTVWSMTIAEAEKITGPDGELLTMTRDDEKGARIARAIKRFGFEDAGIRVHRRVKKCL